MTAMAFHLPGKPRMGTPEYTEYLRRRRCGSKVPYSAEWVARNAAVALSWLSGDYAGLEPYLCPFCDHHHLGHPYYRTTPDYVPLGTRRALDQMIKENDT